MDETYILHRVKKMCEERGWSNYRLAKESGIPAATIHNMMTRTTAPTFATLSKLCDAFHIPLSQFFAEDSFVCLTDEQKELLTFYEQLPDLQKKMVVAYMHGLADREA